MKNTFIAFVLLLMANLSIGQIISNVDSSEYNSSIHTWENKTYKQFQKKQEEKILNSQLTLLNTGLSNIYNSENYAFLYQVRMNPLQALDEFTWKDKKGNTIYDPKKDTLPPTWLINGYLKKNSIKSLTAQNRLFKKAICYLNKNDKNSPLEVLPLSYISNNNQSYFYSQRISSTYGGMVPYRNGLLIAAPEMNGYYYAFFPR